MHSFSLRPPASRLPLSHLLPRGNFSVYAIEREGGRRTLQEERTAKVKGIMLGVVYDLLRKMGILHSVHIQHKDPERHLPVQLRQSGTVVGLIHLQRLDPYSSMKTRTTGSRWEVQN
jgi:hypothetical protein